TNHLLMMFIGIEMASLPSYALAGYLKGRRQSSEAALKYVVYGGGAAGVMLYGISLLAGRFGTAYLHELGAAYVASVGQGAAGFMMMGVATLNGDGVQAVLFYLVTYLLMNLGAFAIAAFLRSESGSEDLADYRGLVRRSPWMFVTLCVFLFSLLGVPPLAGFA